MKMEIPFKLKKGEKYKDSTMVEIQYIVFKLFEDIGIPREDLAELKIEANIYHRHEFDLYYINGTAVIFNTKHTETLAKAAVDSEKELILLGMGVS